MRAYMWCGCVRVCARAGVCMMCGCVVRVCICVYVCMRVSVRGHDSSEPAIPRISLNKTWPSTNNDIETRTHTCFTIVALVAVYTRAGVGVLLVDTSRPVLTRITLAHIDALNNTFNRVSVTIYVNKPQIWRRRGETVAVEGEAVEAAEGEVAEGEAVEGETAAAEGEAAEGEAVEGETAAAEGEAAEGEAAEAAEGEAAEGEAAEGEAAEGEAAEGEAGEGEAGQGEAAETAEGETAAAEGEVAEGETAAAEGEAAEGEAAALARVFFLSTSSEG